MRRFLPGQELPFKSWRYGKKSNLTIAPVNLYSIMKKAAGISPLQEYQLVMTGGKYFGTGLYMQALRGHMPEIDNTHF